MNPKCVVASLESLIGSCGDVERNLALIAKSSLDAHLIDGEIALEQEAIHSLIEKDKHTMTVAKKH